VAGHGGGQRLGEELTGGPHPSVRGREGKEVGPAGDEWVTGSS
jgi:hypothetical protein